MTTRPPARIERRYRRMTLRVELEIETPTGRERWIATTLGAGGLFVPSERPFAIGTRIRVALRLPHEDGRMRLDARVVWCDPPAPGVRTPGMGLEFTDADQRRRLARGLQSLAQAAAG